VDDFFGVGELKVIIDKLGGKYLHHLAGERILSTPSHYAYLKIAEGCDRKFLLCNSLIREDMSQDLLKRLSLRQKHWSVKGVKEINLISQDTTYYDLIFIIKKIT